MGCVQSGKFKGIMGDTAEGGLLQFWELLTVISCAPKKISTSTFGSQIENEGFLKVEEAIL